MDETTSRLRKTFHYPTDGDSDDDFPEALDEEEQETLIETLQTQNAQTNERYAQVLIGIPLISTIPYLTTLFKAHTALLSLLSITSLLSTSYLIYTLPPSLTGLPLLDRLISPSPPSSSASLQSRRNRKPLGSRTAGKGPIATYLPYLNLGLCVVLVGLGAVVGRRFEVWWGFGWLPGLVWGVVVLAKWIMGGVDPVGELGGLRYGYKGA